MMLAAGVPPVLTAMTLAYQVSIGTWGALGHGRVEGKGWGQGVGACVPGWEAGVQGLSRSQSKRDGPALNLSSPTGQPVWLHHPLRQRPGSRVLRLWLHDPARGGCGAAGWLEGRRGHWGMGWHVGCGLASPGPFPHTMHPTTRNATLRCSSWAPSTALLAWCCGQGWACPCGRCWAGGEHTSGHSWSPLGPGPRQ